jgi:stress-induced morphogen
MYFMTAQQIEDRIKSNFPDADVVVMDTTGGNDHFDVRVASQVFDGLSRIKCHQKVMDLFRDELKTGEVHAFSLKTINKG